MSTACASSTATVIYCPRESMLSAAKVLACGTGARCVPGITRMLPDSGVAGVSAIQAVTNWALGSPQ